MAHIVTCQCCKARFDRDKFEYVVTGRQRYAHANCYLRARQEDSTLPELEIFDPTDIVECAYCHQKMSKKKDAPVQLSNGKYVHKHCAELEEKREKTDSEKLNDYIMKLFEVNYVSPKIKKQINTFIQEYNYSYSGIQKALCYYFEVKHGDIDKSGGGIGIVPYIYKDAYNYYYDLWCAQQKNEKLDMETYVPKVKEISIEAPKRKTKQDKKFSFLDNDDVGEDTE